MTNLILIVIGAVLVNNFVLSRFLGICPFLGVSKKVETATGMGMAVIFVMTLASMITWVVQYTLLEPFNLDYLKTITFILVIAALVQLVEMTVQKIAPPLYEALGIYLPLITTNCAVLGAALINIQEKYSFLEATVFGFASAIGFTLAIVIFAGLRERIELCEVPESMKGVPIAFITAGILALAFLGFAGLVK
ncbi:MAG: electron transport complex subunit RsxA [Acidobacteria bacterium]|nr:electron transport complex subunit RsxA [Acidobacteriota bacterium]